MSKLRMLPKHNKVFRKNIKIRSAIRSNVLLPCIIALIVLLTGYFALADQNDFTTYCNQRFGFCVDYPKELTIGPEPVNRDGRRFYDSKGFVVIASGHNNALDYTLEQEMRDRGRESFEKIKKRNKGGNWFVLSGYKASENIYVKTYVGEATINTLYIKYPRQFDKEYKATVLKISDSFRPGRLDFPN